MKMILSRLPALLLLTIGVFQAEAGTVFYAAIPASQSDANSGISASNQYTSAVDGGNTRGTDRVVNGITLHALTGSGQSSTADNCTLNTLSGTLNNAGGSPANIQADGALAEVQADMTFNAGAGDNSQQEIVLDPASLTPGTTYDLRIYIGNSGGQNRPVNLAFVGDGQAPVETGFFNEDDARTSAGGFKEANQVYYVDYRFTWDGNSTPGVTITQKSGSAPFCLYALTNQPVTGAVAAEGGEAEAGEGLSAGFVNAESDQVGVSSDDFYNSESLNTNGRWIKWEKWGTCWQPTNVTSGWSPYTNGSWRQCDDCGWTFISEEPWAWCCYHYGRWCKIRTGCGWAWVPGKVWASSWVSWRQGQNESCSCIGWAPLPPEASCEIGVGISTWVDRTCDIGPDCYIFINIRDFGVDSFFGCGCIYERTRNVTIINETINITNIVYNRNVTYSGGPDYNWCNERIRKFGGKEIAKISVNRYDDPAKIKGGKFSHVEGNQLALLSPHVKGDKHPQHAPKVAETVASNKIDHGWSNVKDPKIEKELKQKIADETKGKTPKTFKATLPPDVAQKITKAHGLGKTATPGQSPLLSAGKKLPTTSGAPAGTAAPPGKHPGKPFNLPATGPTATPSGKLTPAIRHPGQPLNLPTTAAPATPTISPTGKHPGKAYNLPTTGATPTAAPTPIGKRHKPPTSLQPQGVTGSQPTPARPRHFATPPLTPPLTPPQYYKPTPSPQPLYNAPPRPRGRPTLTPTPTPRRR